MVRPFHSKALCTMRRVLESMGMEGEYNDVLQKTGERVD